MSRVDLRIGDEGVDGYRLLTALVVPRPIAWVTSVDERGVVNLAPHSFFSVASASPPVVCFTSVGHKDTLHNLESTGEFVINVASAPQLHAVNDSSAPYDRGVSEPASLGIALEPSTWVGVPRVAHSPAAIECRLYDVVPVGDSFLVLGAVLGATIDEAALVAGTPSYDALAPLARLGGSEWALPGEVVSLDRPTVA